MEDVAPVLVPGYRLDRYELVTPIASGGMASVWLARLRGKRGFEKLFAIKTIKAELTEDARFQEMFLDEARIASAIQHPNVAQILDLGEQDDILYIVMEWVDGDSLSKIRRLAQKKGRPMPLGLALRALADACAGLHAAHELADRQGESLNVVHRDVSPHNILVSSAGSVKVIDFGIAKARDRQAGETRTGVVKGKIRYMAPEQARGKPVDRRADVWAVGVCLHELLTGELPFQGDDIEILRRLLGEEAPPRPGGAVPQPIEDLLARSLVRDPEARFPTAAAMARAILAALEELGLPSSNEDIADFLRTNLPELETARRDAVERALSASRAREAQGAPATPELPVVSEGQSTPRVAADAPTVAFPKTASSTTRDRAPKTTAVEPAAPTEESKATLAAAATTRAPAESPTRGRGAWWLVGLVAAAAGGWLVWSSGAGRHAPAEPDPPPRTASGALPSAPSGTTSAPAGKSPPASASATGPTVPTAAPQAELADAAASAAAPVGRKRRKKGVAPAASAAPGEAPPEDESPYD